MQNFHSFLSDSLRVEKHCSHLPCPECLKAWYLLELLQLQTVRLWNPQAMQKCSHPDGCWISNEDQCLPSTYQYLFPNDHKALLCSAETWDPYNIYNGKWKAFALWLERVPSGLCSCCCAALLRDRMLSQLAELMSLRSCCYPRPKFTPVF